MSPPASKSSKGDSEGESIPPSTNLWVGNLSPEVADSELMDLFANYGALDSVTTYSARNFAFVYFKRVEDAYNAKDALQGTTLRGFALKIEYARPAKPCKCLWVGALSEMVSKEQLEEEFMKYGKIEDFKFFRERNSALVEYFKLDDALQAMKNMNGKRVGGEQIRVDFLRSQPSRREQLSDLRDSRESQILGMQSGARRAQHQPSGVMKEGQPSNILWIGYPPSLQIDEQMLHNAMILFGEIERIKSFPAKHYSFVEFRSVDEARRAKEGLQGRLFNDPRITIMYSSSELGPGKDYNFYPGIKDPRPDMFSDQAYGPSHMEMFDHHHSMGLSAAGRLPVGGSHRLNLPPRPFAPRGGFDPELAFLHAETWKRPSPRAGILPSPVSRIKQPMRSGSSGWDVLDAAQFHREPKRSRVNPALSVDEDSLSPRMFNDNGLSLNRAYGLGPSSPSGFANVRQNNSLSPVGNRGSVGGPNQGYIDNDFIWRGIIAKGGTPVCHARCVPIGTGIDFELPEIVNCSARTGLDMLTKHYAEAIGFDIVFFLPDSEDDFASYTEFLRYLCSKDRAGVAKFAHNTTLFLVPPSDFLTEVLKVKGPERLYGVVLKLPQQILSGVPMQPQLLQSIHSSQYIDRHQIPLSEENYNLLPQKGESVVPIDHTGVLHDDSKLPSKFIYHPTSDSSVASSLPQDYPPNITIGVSQVGVSLTPELIATLASILPANAQASASESGQPVVGPGPYSSIAPEKGTPLQGWKHETQISGSTSNFQMGNQFSPHMQVHTYPTISNIPDHAGNMVHNLTQIQDSSGNLPNLTAIPSRPLASFSMPSQSAQITAASQVGQQYQVEVPYGFQKGYGGFHGTDGPGSYSPSVSQQLHNAVTFPSQVQVSNYSQTLPGVPMPADKVNLELPNQVLQFQNAPSGAAQSTSDVEVDKNQRYQSTLQFAASLLLQIQQQQQQQSGTSAARGSGNQ